MENFEYVKSNTWRDDFENNEKDKKEKRGLHVLRDNQQYYRHRINNESIYWKCVHAKKEAKCKGSVTIDDNGKIVAEVAHTGHDALTEKEIAVLKFKILVKHRCQTENLTASKIYSQEQSNLVSNYNFSNEDLAKFAPSYHRMESCLKKRRGKTRAKLPKEIREIKLVGEYTTTKSGNKFLILNTKNNKILLFCSPDGIACLADTPHWHADGTFHVASKYYYQLYIIQGWFKDRMIPCAFALMHRRRTQDYIKLLKALQRAKQRLYVSFRSKYNETFI
jgi:hypothetical protein